MDERELIERTKAGKQDAFEALVSTYEQKIYHMALRYTANPQDALDICQEVFLRVFRFLPGFAQNSSFSTWIYRITANVCKDTLRKRSKTMELSFATQDEDEPFEHEVADLRYNPEDALMQNEMREQLARGIAELPEKYRQVVILRDINGLTYDEIARCLDLEEGTVKSRIARGRDRLRKFLSKSGNFSSAVQSKESKGGKA